MSILGLSQSYGMPPSPVRGDLSEASRLSMDLRQSASNAVLRRMVLAVAACEGAAGAAGAAADEIAQLRANVNRAARIEAARSHHVFPKTYQDAATVGDVGGSSGAGCWRQEDASGRSAQAYAKTEAALQAHRRARLGLQRRQVGVQSSELLGPAAAAHIAAVASAAVSAKEAAAEEALAQIATMRAEEASVMAQLRAEVVVARSELQAETDSRRRADEEALGLGHRLRRAEAELHVSAAEVAARHQEAEDLDRCMQAAMFEVTSARAAGDALAAEAAELQRRLGAAVVEVTETRNDSAMSSRRLRDDMQRVAAQISAGVQAAKADAEEEQMQAGCLLTLHQRNSSSLRRLLVSHLAMQAELCARGVLLSWKAACAAADEEAVHRAALENALTERQAAVEAATIAAEKRTAILVREALEVAQQAAAEKAIAEIKAACEVASQEAAAEVQAVREVAQQAAAEKAVAEIKAACEVASQEAAAEVQAVREVAQETAAEMAGAEIKAACEAASQEAAAEVQAVRKAATEAAEEETAILLREAIEAANVAAEEKTREATKAAEEAAAEKCAAGVKAACEAAWQEAAVEVEATRNAAAQSELAQEIAQSRVENLERSIACAALAEQRAKESEEDVARRWRKDDVCALVRERHHLATRRMFLSALGARLECFVLGVFSAWHAATFVAKAINEVGEASPHPTQTHEETAELRSLLEAAELARAEAVADSAGCRAEAAEALAASKAAQAAVKRSHGEDDVSLEVATFAKHAQNMHVERTLAASRLIFCTLIATQLETFARGVLVAWDLSVRASRERVKRIVFCRWMGRVEKRQESLARYVLVGWRAHIHRRAQFLQQHEESGLAEPSSLEQVHTEMRQMKVELLHTASELEAAEGRARHLEATYMHPREELGADNRAEAREMAAQVRASASQAESLASEARSAGLLTAQIAATTKLVASREKAARLILITMLASSMEVVVHATFKAWVAGTRKTALDMSGGVNAGIQVESKLPSKLSPASSAPPPPKPLSSRKDTKSASSTPRSADGGWQNDDYRQYESEEL